MISFVFCLFGATCRSYKRYFYRNKESGAIQWEYPVIEDEPVVSELQTEEVGGGEEAMCISPEPSPPPPPYISERSKSLSPPPPPRISSPEQEAEVEPNQVTGNNITISAFVSCLSRVFPRQCIILPGLINCFGYSCSFPQKLLVIPIKQFADYTLQLIHFDSSMTTQYVESSL